MRTIREEYSGFFPALLAAQKAQNEALEVCSTAVLRDLPTDEEMAQQLCTEYNLVNCSWPTRTLGTYTTPAGIDASLGPSVASADAQTLTDPFPIPMDTDVPGPSSSRSCSRSRFPSHSRPKRPHTSDPAPIRSENFSRPYRRSATRKPPPLSTADLSSPDKMCSPVPDIPVPISEQPCWNCKRFGHKYSSCPRPRSCFCYKCGRPGTRVDS